MTEQAIMIRAGNCSDSSKPWTLNLNIRLEKSLEGHKRHQI